METIETLNPTHKIITNSRGRFFGLYTKNGNQFNARLLRETPETYLFLDNNSGDIKRIKKRSVSAVVIAGVRTEA